jgi:hypothetical protein
MENEITYNINLSNERFISLFNNRIETRHNPYIINFIHNYDRNQPNRNLYNHNQPNRNLYNIIPMGHGLSRMGPGLSLLATWSSISNDEIVLPPLISDDELVFPPLISDDELVFPPLISDDELVFPPLISDEIVLPAFVEQEFLIPDDAVCGITFEKPDCCTLCAHYFCRAEITRWLKQQKKEHKKMTCPTCRAEIPVVIPDNAKRELNLYDVD